MINRLKTLAGYRELLFHLVKKELKLKYRGSVLGFFWSLLSPVLMMVVFTLIFSFVFKFNIKNFPIFLLCGLLPWNFHSLTLGSSTGSIVGSANLIKKVYFPREILPASIVLANLVNFLLEFLVLIVFLIGFGFPFYTYLYFLVIIIILQIIFSLGLGLLLAALNVLFRDVEHFVGILLLVWFYACPIIYPAEKVLPAKYIGVYYLNPMAALVTLYRQVLYYGQPPDSRLLAYAAISAALMFGIGYAVFLRLEPEFAEEV